MSKDPGISQIWYQPHQVVSHGRRVQFPTLILNAFISTNQGISDYKEKENVFETNHINKLLLRQKRKTI